MSTTNTNPKLKIDDMAFGGKGVGRHEGAVVFVPFTAPGDTVTVRITRQKKRFAEAELVSVDEASPDRVAPGCQYFGKCGGCSYQHIRYERQLEIKEAQAVQTLRRIGKLDSIPMRPIVASPKPYGYRNRIRVHITDGMIGFYRHDRHELLDIHECPIASIEVNAALARLRARPVTDGDCTVAGEQGSRFFSQVNDAVAALLLEHVRALLRKDRSVLIDAYCGAGFFARGCLDHAAVVIGIEENAFAIEQARRMAGPKEKYLEGDVAGHLPGILREQEPGAASLILDPPATGLDQQVVAAILESPPTEIIYISCNPATLARDLSLLKSAYDIASVTPFDMFPQTAQIEVAVHLRLAR